MTYVHTGEGWLYVATVIELASRTVVGWASSKRIDTSLAIRASANAIASGHVKPDAIFHTDHGVQYRSRRFRKYCKKNAIRQSMGSNFECWDNAVAESFFSKLKGERLDWCTFATRAAAVYEVADYIRYFNTRRRHQTLGYATPAATLRRLTQPPRPRSRPDKKGDRTTLHKTRDVLDICFLLKENLPAGALSGSPATTQQDVRATEQDIFTAAGQNGGIYPAEVKMSC